MKKLLLTKSQIRVFRLIALGYMNKDIADMLSVSIKTVEKHRQDAMNRLNIHDSVTLTHYALAHGMVTNLFRQNGAKI